jgi:hypothetical protein
VVKGSSSNILWTDNELTSAVDAYVFVLQAQRAGLSYPVDIGAGVLLSGSLITRNDASLRYRMRNISAVVREMGDRCWPSIRQRNKWVPTFGGGCVQFSSTSRALAGKPSPPSRANIWRLSTSAPSAPGRNRHAGIFSSQPTYGSPDGANAGARRIHQKTTKNPPQHRSPR